VSTSKSLGDQDLGQCAFALLLSHTRCDTCVARGRMRQ
jgi:hypothetical protein